MSFTLYDGPNFSGRSAALRAFAWSGEGQYLHPLLEVNASGLAATVGGEARALRVEDGGEVGRLIGDLPRDRALRTLSGGELARVLLTHTLASRPPRLSLDGVLEQLDLESRRLLLANLLPALAGHTDVAIVDHNSAQLLPFARDVRRFDRADDAPPTFEASSVARALSDGAEAHAIELTGLSFRHRGMRRPIFEDATFAFRPGRPYLLKAPNGAGKSTLAQLLAGVLTPTRGVISVAGRRSAAGQMFYAFQDPLAQIIGTSSRDYLKLIERVARRAGRRPRLDADNALQLLGLGRFAEAEPFDLPFLLTKRLAIAASLVSGASWIFLDEPALGCDTAGRAAMRGLFESLCLAGLGVIIVSHGTEFDDLRDVVRITLRNGLIVQGGGDDE